MDEYDHLNNLMEAIGDIYRWWSELPTFRQHLTSGAYSRLECENKPQPEQAVEVRSPLQGRKGPTDQDPVREKAGSQLPRPPRHSAKKEIPRDGALR